MPHPHAANTADVPSIPLSTDAGQRRIRLTLALSVLTSIAMAVAFVALGRLVGNGHSAMLLVVAILSAAVAIAAQVSAQWIAATTARREQQPLRERLLRRWWAGTPDEHDHESAGEKVALMTESVERVSIFRQTFMGPMIGTLLGPFAVLIVLALAVDAVAAALLALALPVIPLTVQGFNKAFRKVSGESRRARMRLANRYLESIQGLETITMLGAAPRVEEDLAAVGEMNRQATMRLLARNQLVLFVTDGIFSLGAVTTAAVLAAWRLDSGAITPGGAIAIVLCSILLLAPLDMVGSFFYVGMTGQAAQRSLRTFLHEKARAGGATGPAVATDEPDHVVDVRNAVLGYRGKPVVQGVTLRLDEHEHAVILGPSGGGKSTLLKALKGDIVPISGDIHVDGVPLTLATRSTVRSRSALVAQTTWLFTGTIASNLRLGRADATDDELWDALRLVDLAGFVERAPLGLDTPVGERGLALSGGEAQRLSLARAFLSGRDLLLLDEPTSQVDLHSEHAIQNALEEMSGSRTIVLVTHRPSMAREADSTWHMRDGVLTQEEVQHV